MRRITVLAYLLAVSFWFFGLLGAPTPVRGSPLAQGSGITLVAPATCPAGGCAAGQRLTYHLEFDLANSYRYVAGANNVKVCLYIPDAWYDGAAVSLDETGGVTGNIYTLGDCAEDDDPPIGYTLAAAGGTEFTGGVVFDTLNFSFRILGTASSPGFVLMRVFEHVTVSGDPPDDWQPTTYHTELMTPVLPGTTLYVAASPSACTASPCYLNSGGDYEGGVGTGLKDAVDVASADAESNTQIVILGTVGLKGNTVRVNKPLTLTGSGDATLTASGGGCDQPLLEVSAGGALRGLNLTDGSCASPDRNLLIVNSAADYLIESNDFSGGADAIRVRGITSANLIVRYNHISGNSGYALFWEGGEGGGTLNMVANNLGPNRSGDPVQCADGATSVQGNRRINHNYWGGQAAPSADSTHCVATAGKQLGAPILANADSPGVAARRVTVTVNKTYQFDNQIAYWRSGDGNDFDLYLVDHGADSPNAVPFTSGSTGGPNPCSDYWDVFLAADASPGGTLELSIKYNRSSACVAVIESSQFCEQTSDAAKFPLWWYDPAGLVTAGWDTTGQSPAGSGAGGASGQTTTCDMASDEIRVSVDTSGRPNLGKDLNYTPFVIGLPVPSTFKTLASDKTVTVVWTTTSEADLSGYYVLRSASASGPFDPISDLVERRGSALTGTTYTFVDGGRTNGVANYYRLKIVKTDDTFFYSDILSIVPNVATATPTATRTPTRTPTLTRTPTVRIPTATRYPTATRFATATRRVGTPTRTSTSSPGSANRTPTPRGTGYPGPEDSDGTPGYPGPDNTPGTGTPTALNTLRPGEPTRTLTRTPTPSGTVSEEEDQRDASDWISLVMGLLMSAVVVLGLAWFFFIRRKV